MAGHCHTRLGSINGGLEGHAREEGGGRDGIKCWGLAASSGGIYCAPFGRPVEVAMDANTHLLHELCAGGVCKRLDSLPTAIYLSILSIYLSSSSSSSCGPPHLLHPHSQLLLRFKLNYNKMVPYKLLQKNYFSSIITIETKTKIIIIHK